MKTGQPQNDKSAGRPNWRNLRLGKSSPLGPGPIPRAAKAGLTIIELVIASGIIAVLLLASAAAMGENVESSETSKRLVRGAVFLESVQEDLASLST